MQQFKHFPIACNELFHMVHINQKCFPLKICRDRIMDKHPCKWLGCDLFKLGLAIPLVWKVQFQQVHFYIACNELSHMVHLNQKCFSPENLS